MKVYLLFYTTVFIAIHNLYSLSVTHNRTKDFLKGDVVKCDDFFISM